MNAKPQIPGQFVELQIGIFRYVRVRPRPEHRMVVVSRLKSCDVLFVFRMIDDKRRCEHRQVIDGVDRDGNVVSSSQTNAVVDFHRHDVGSGIVTVRHVNELVTND